jgi:hypothetical protein
LYPIGPDEDMQGLIEEHKEKDESHKSVFAKGKSENMS